MRAVVVEKFVTPAELRVTTAPDPLLEHGHVLVEVKAAGCNFFDTLIVQGRYQTKPPFPFSPGGEISGVVSKVAPGTTGIAVGDRVFAYVGYGGFAEHVSVLSSHIVPMPDGMSFEEAAAFPIVYGTAYSAVVQRGGTRPGETLAVTAAAGGVGLAAVQIGKAWGARVIALASGDKLDVARAAGADTVLDYRKEGWPDDLMAATSGKGVDVIVENVGGDVFDGAMKCVSWGGRVVVVGFASGKIPELKLNRVLLKHVSIVGVHWGPMHEREIGTIKSGFDALTLLYKQKKIAPLVSRTFPVEDVAQALEALGSRQTVGKVVLTF
jgi:NADPH2:quinone reductase